MGHFIEGQHNSNYSIDSFRASCDSFGQARLFHLRQGNASQDTHLLMHELRPHHLHLHLHLHGVWKDVTHGLATRPKHGAHGPTHATKRPECSRVLHLHGHPKGHAHHLHWTRPLREPHAREVAGAHASLLLLLLQELLLLMVLVARELMLVLAVLLLL